MGICCGLTVEGAVRAQQENERGWRRIACTEAPLTPKTRFLMLGVPREFV